MKKILYIAFLLLPLVGVCQIERTILIDGLTLASKLNESDFEAIEEYVRINGFVSDPKETTSDLLVFHKSDQNSNLGLVIDLRNNYPKIGFIMIGNKYSFVSAKIKRILQSDLNTYKIDEFTYAISFKKDKNIPISEDGELCENLFFLLEMNFPKDSPIIEFRSPYCIDNEIDWNKAFIEYFKN